MNELIEEIIRTHLIDEIELPVYTEEPAKPPRKYMLIERVGSGGDSAAHAVAGAMIAVQSISAESLYSAALMNEEVKGAMWGLERHDRVCKVRCNSDSNFTDPETHRYRYQALFEITYYN